MTTPQPTQTIQLNNNDLDLSLNVGRVMFGKQNGRDLGNLEDGPISKMFLDPLVMGQTVWALYEDKLKKIGIETCEDLFNLMSGDVVSQLSEGMKVAISDFFRAWGPQVIEQIEKKIANLAQTISDAESGETSGELPEFSKETLAT